MAEGPEGTIEPGYVPPAQRTPPPSEGPEGTTEVGYVPPPPPPSEGPEGTVERGYVPPSDKVARARARGAPVFPAAASTPAPVPAAAPVMNAAQTDAWALVQTELDKWGLGGLSGLAKDLIIGGAGREEVARRIRETNEHKTRFAGMIARQKAGYNAIDESEYLGMEDSYRATMRQYGFPTGLYDDPTDFATYIGNDVSADEFTERVANGYQWAQDADPYEKAQLQALYGMTDGDFAAAALDPERALPFLWNRKQATEIAAQASRAGWGQLTAQEAENLNRMGVTEQQAGEGFGRLQVYRPLFEQAIGETGGDITREEQLGATFGGDVVQAQRITRRQRQRQNASQAGGTAVTTGAGVTGLGSVS